MYNFHHELESEEENEDAELTIQLLQDAINSRHIESFYTHTTNKPNKRKRTDNVDNRGAGGGAGGVSATDSTELGAHGYKVKLPVRDIVDEKGGVLKAPFRSKVRHLV